MSKEDRVTIKIPRVLYAKLNAIIKESSFNSVTDFIIYVLRDLIATETEKHKGESLTKKEIAVIRERLKNLGYI